MSDQKMPVSEAIAEIRKVCENLSSRLEVLEKKESGGPLRYVASALAPAFATQLSTPGAQFIGELEGFRPYIYDDHTGQRIGTGGAMLATLEAEASGYPTIGYGHVITTLDQEAGRLRKWFNSGITRTEAAELLKLDAARAVSALNKTGLRFEQHQFDALVCFIFNIGVGAWSTSSCTLHREIYGTPRENWCALVRRELPRWKYSKGVLLPGLQARRQETIALFCEGDYRLGSSPLTV